MRTKTWVMAAVALGLASGPAWAQTTASGKSVAGAPIAGSGTPRAGTGIPDRELGETQAPAAGRATGVVPAGAVPAQERVVRTAPGATVGTATAGAMNDGLFAAAAAGSGLCEVASSRLAEEKGGSDAVKRFAEHMIHDHSQANQELIGLASQKGMTLPQTLPIPAQAEQAALAGVSGEKFDRCFIKQQMAAHIQAVGLFEAEAERGQDPQLKAWAAKTLPKLKEHMREVKKMHEDMEAKEQANPHRD